MNAAYALDAVLQEIVFVGGPLLVAFVSGLGTPGAVIMAALVALLGIAVFAAAPPVRQRRAEAREADRAGPLRPGTPRVLLFGFPFVGGTLGMLNIAVVACGEGMRSTAMSGPVLGVNALGVLAGGLVHGSRSWSDVAGARLRSLALARPRAAGVRPGAAAAPAYGGGERGVLLPALVSAVGTRRGCELSVFSRCASQGVLRERFSVRQDLRVSEARRFRGECAMSAPSATSGSEVVRGLQERAARALPVEHVEEVGGWWLRHAPGCSWWVGTALPHGGAERGELGRRVEEVEEFYAGHGTSARFQISPGACPAGLDAVLAERGYRRESSLSLQVASTARVQEQVSAGALRVRVDDRPTRAWFETWHTVHGGDSRSERDLLGRVERPSAYASAMSGDAVLAVGRAVADTGWAGVFGMATLPESRGRGAARDVLATLADWAGAHEADRMYLQVERDNSPALRLYERVGFSEVCGYHYRTAG